jgi:tape measure domain-containing protein
VSIAAIRESVIRAGLDASAYEAGAKRVQAANQNMASSGDRVVATQEKATRATLSGAGAVERLQRELDRTYAAQRKFEQAQDRITQATQRGHLSYIRGNELLDLARQRYLGTGTAAERAAEGVSRFSVAGNAALGAVEGMTSRLGPLGLAIGALGPIGIAAGVALSAIAAALVPIAKAGDAATAAIARLTAATGSIESARAAYQGLYEISARTGVAVSEGAATFQRFRIAAGEIGATNAQVLRLVEGLQKAAVVSGAVGQEGAAAMMQLGQALASGKLNGDELRSVMENMPSLAQALARELGTNIGQLRKMGEEGSLTADRVFPALLLATEKMSADFDKMPLTMSRAFSILGVEMTRFAESLDEALGVSEAIAKAVKAAADAVRGVRQAAVPTPEERAAKDVAEGERGIAAVQARLRGAESDIAMYQASGLSRQQAMDLAVPTLAGAKSVAQEMAEAEAILRRGLLAQFEQRAAAVERENQASEEAARKATESARTRTAAALEEQRLRDNKFAKAAEDHAKRMKVIDDAAAAGVTKHRDGSVFDAAAERAQAAKDYADQIKKLREAESRDSAKSTREIEKEIRTRDKVLDKLRVELDARQRMAQAQGQGEAAVRNLNDQIAVENALRDAGIPITGKRTEAEERYARAIEATVLGIESAKRAEKEVADARAKAKQEFERTAREIESQARRVSDDVATSIYEGLVEGRRGQNVLAWFGNLFKRIAIQAASTQILLPITTAIIGGIPQLFGVGAAGASGGGSLLSSFGQLSGLSNLLPTGGIGGMLSGLGTSIFGSAGTAVGPLAEIIGASPGLLGLGGTSLMGGSALTLGSAFSGIGGGFAAGTMLNSLLGRSPAQQTNGMIGSALGSIAGFLVGGPLGGLLGGAAGGGLGGLIGPGESVNAWGYALRSTGPGDGAGAGTGLQPIDRRYYNEAGAQQFAQADAAVAAINAFLAQNNLLVGGAIGVGGNKNGPEYGPNMVGSFSEAFSKLWFGSQDDTRLNSYLSGQSFDDPAKLQAAVEGFKAAAAAIDALGREAVPEFTASMQAINDNFDAAVEQAKKYGLAEDNLTTARAKAIASLEKQRTETLRQSALSLNVRYMRALGMDDAANLAAQAEAARIELEAFAAQLDAFAVTAAERADLLTRLQAVQAAEAQKIITDQAQATRDAWIAAGQSIRAYLDGMVTGTAAGASPTDRLAAAQEAFERDRILGMGGDRDALGRVTGSADALLAAGRDMFASGPAFQALVESVRTGLTNLPVVQSYDAQQAASLAAIQQAIETGTLNTATMILPGGNVVQIAGGFSVAGVEAGLAAVNTTLGAMHVSQYAIGEATNSGLAVLGEITASAAAGTVAGLAALNASLHTLNVSLADLNTSLHTINVSAVTGLGSVNATLGAMHVSSYAIGEATNGALAVLGDIAAGTTTATVLGLAALNLSLHTLNVSLADLNTSLHTINVSTVTGLGSVNASLAAINTSIVAGDAALVTALAMINASTVAGHAGVAQIAAGGLDAVFAGLVVTNDILVSGFGAVVAAVAASKPITANDNLPALTDINTSLGAVDASVRDVNTSLATVDGRIATGLAVVNASIVAGDAALMNGLAVGNSLAAAILAAAQAGSAHGLVTAGQIQVVANQAHSAVLHIATHQQYTLQGNARLVEINSSLGAGMSSLNTSLAAINASTVLGDSALNASLAAINAANVMGMGSVNTSLAAVNTMALSVGQATHSGLTAIYSALTYEMQLLRQEVAQLKAQVQQGATLVANETRAAGLYVGGKVEETTDQLRKAA